MMQTLFDILQSANDLLWSYIVITMLIGCALLFTFRSRGIQFRLLSDMFRVMADKPVGKRQTGEPDDQGDDKKATTKKGAKEELERLKKIGSFQAFAVSLSSRVGTGNLAGVASAIFVGGPGAVFWMWMMALLGAATAFVEATLAQLYKKRGQDSFYGGPAYYMQQ